MLDKQQLHDLVHRLAQLTQEQGSALEQSDIEHFMQLSDQRQLAIQELLLTAKNDEAQTYLQTAPELSSELQQIMQWDHQHIQQIQQLMQETQTQLRQITTGRNAFYAYAGRDQLVVNEETHFIDRQQS